MMTNPSKLEINDILLDPSNNSLILVLEKEIDLNNCSLLLHQIVYKGGAYRYKASSDQNGPFFERLIKIN